MAGFPAMFFQTLPMIERLLKNRLGGSLEVVALHEYRTVEFQLDANQLEQFFEVEFSLVDLLDQFTPVHRLRVANDGSIDRHQLDPIFRGVKLRRKILGVVLFQIMAQVETNA